MILLRLLTFLKTKIQTCNFMSLYQKVKLQFFFKLFQSSDTCPEFLNYILPNDDEVALIKTWQRIKETMQLNFLAQDEFTWYFCQSQLHVTTFTTQHALRLHVVPPSMRIQPCRLPKYYNCFHVTLKEITTH